MLLHTCCADCLLKIYQTLSEAQRQDLQIFFYNPNIYPREEYMTRLSAVKRVAATLTPKPKVLVPHYQPQTYFEALEPSSSSGECFRIIPQRQRCPRCWKLRLQALFEYAVANNIKTVSSTLLASSYQDVKTIVKIAQELAREYQLDFYVPDASQLDHPLPTCGFYKQYYCGCLYSLVEKSREKYGL